MAKISSDVLRDRKRFDLLTKSELIAAISRLERRMTYLKFLLSTK